MSTMKAKPQGPECDVCKKELKDWQGNVMVPNYKPDSISDLRVWCKPCTVSEDKSTRGVKHHNIWELIWVKENFIDCLGSVLSGLLSSPQTWSKTAVEAFYRLGATAHPELAENPVDGVD